MRAAESLAGELPAPSCDSVPSVSRRETEADQSDVDIQVRPSIRDLRGIKNTTLSILSSPVTGLDPVAGLDPVTSLFSLLVLSITAYGGGVAANANV